MKLTIITILALAMAGQASAANVQFMPGTYAFLENEDFSEYMVYIEGIVNFDFFNTSGEIRVSGLFLGEGNPECDCSNVQGGVRNPDPNLGYLVGSEVLPFTLPPRTSTGPIDTVVMAVEVPLSGAYCPRLILIEDLAAIRDDVRFACEYFDTTPNVPPVSSFSMTPSAGDAPLTVNVNGSASFDSDGVITEYRWITSDGQVAFGPSTSFTFGAGDHAITLTVTDDDGAVDSTERSITVGLDACLERPDIIPGTTINGVLSVDDCLSMTFVDYYTIFLPEAGQLTVGMSSQTIDSYLLLATIDLNTIFAEDDDGGGGRDALFTTDLPAGSYVVVAASFDSGETGPYSLTTEIAVPEPSTEALGLAALSALALIARVRGRGDRYLLQARPRA
jgi:PKD repeat protein